MHLGAVTAMKGEFVYNVHAAMYFLLFTHASHDTSQLRGYTSVVPRSNAQLNMKGILGMDGCLLIKCFYET